MHELTAICQAASVARNTGEALFLATVTRVRGSAYRHPGAHLLFSHGAALAGSVSGGCLEADIVRAGAWAVRDGSILRTYEAHADGDSPEPRGSGCGGTVDILLESLVPGSPCDPLAFVADCLAAERRAIMVSVFQSARSDVSLGARLLISPSADVVATTIESRELERELVAAAELALIDGRTREHTTRDGSLSALVEVIDAPPHLFVFGTGSDVVPLVQLARMIGWKVSVCAPSARITVQTRFHNLAPLRLGSAAEAVLAMQRSERALAVVMSHDYERDRDALSELLKSSVRYLGVLGPRERTERLLHDLGRANDPTLHGQLSRLHGPCGLHLGGDSPSEIALSILAEAQAALNGNSALPLRDRKRVHEPAAARPTLRLVASRRS
jgi:xanthine dehydrogenase accessory factor